MMQRRYYAFLMMLMSPVLALAMTFRSHHVNYKRWALVLFVTIYGSTWGIVNLGDGTVHWQNVYDHYVNLGVEPFLHETADILLLRNNTEVDEDLYIHVISFITGGIFRLPGMFFVVVAFVYGYFFSGSIFRLFQSFPSIRKNKVIFVLALLFILMLNVVSMNTVRTWTGFWILFYACISYYMTGQRKYLWLMFVPPLVHVGYFIMAIPAWAVAIFGNRKWLYSGIFLFSFFTTFFGPIEAIQQLKRWEVGQEKVSAYQLEQEKGIGETLDQYGGSRWYLQYNKLGIHQWGVVGIAVLILVSGRYFRDMDYVESSFFSIGIVTKALSNSTWFIYALSNRSSVIAMHFILAAVLLYWQRTRYDTHNPVFGRMEYIFLGIISIAILPYFVFQLANIIQYTSAFILYMPFLTWFSEDLHITIRELLGYL